MSTSKYFSKNWSAHDTLLSLFIKKARLKYVEIPRKGTPRNAAKEFSADKNSAALFSITAIKPKEIAENIGISYPLIRKWKTESSFTNRINEYAEKFIDNFIDEFVEKVVSLRKGDTYISLEEYRSKLPTNEWGYFSDLRDVPFYGTPILDKMPQAIASIEAFCSAEYHTSPGFARQIAIDFFSSFPEINTFKFMPLSIPALTQTIAIPKDSEKKDAAETVRSLRKQLKNGIIHTSDIIEDYLYKKLPEGESKKSIINGLSMIKQMLDQLIGLYEDADFKKI